MAEQINPRLDLADLAGADGSPRSRVLRERPLPQLKETDNHVTESLPGPFLGPKSSIDGIAERDGPEAHTSPHLISIDKTCLTSSSLGFPSRFVR